MVDVTGHGARSGDEQRTPPLRDTLSQLRLRELLTEVQDRVEEIIRVIWSVEKKLNTVVALGVGTRCDADGEETVVAPVLEKLGYKLYRAKTNLGLGRAVLQKTAPAQHMETAPQA